MTEVASIQFELPKPKEEFRNYKDSFRHDIVEHHYRLMRANQTVAFARKMNDKYSFDKPRCKMTIREAFKVLETYVDSSDPDVSLPNLIHMLQTAEGIRKAGHPEWFQLVGLLHDMGKLMFLWGNSEDGQVGTAEGPQWALGGDTWVTGCKIPDCAVFPQFNDLNPDMHDDRYNTELGMYTAHCGMDKLLYAYGHDEYLYQMLVANKAKIPEEGLAMIRYHSCYPWHTGGAYRQFMNETDHALLNWVLEFNKFDLYTKDQKDQAGLLNSPEIVEGLWHYYEGLIEKFFPTSELSW